LSDLSRPAILIALACLICMPASAHMSSPGAEGFVRGIGHPVFEPVQGLLAAMCGLLLGRAERRASSQAWKALLACPLLSLISFLFVFSGHAVPVLAMLMVCALVAIVVAAWSQPPGPLVTGLAALSGLLLGANAVSTGSEGQIATSSGALLGAAMGIVYLAGAALWLKDREAKLPWLAYVPRVIAAWGVAITVMLVAFELRPVLAGQAA